jgi:hypothetical protein
VRYQLSHPSPYVKLIGWFIFAELCLNFKAMSPIGCKLGLFYIVPKKNPKHATPEQDTGLQKQTESLLSENVCHK